MDEEEIKALINELELRKRKDKKYFSRFTTFHVEGFIDGLKHSVGIEVESVIWIRDQLKEIENEKQNRKRI